MSGFWKCVNFEARGGGGGVMPYCDSNSVSDIIQYGSAPQNHEDTFSMSSSAFQHVLSQSSHVTLLIINSMQCNTIRLYEMKLKKELCP